MRSRFSGRSGRRTGSRTFPMARKRIRRRTCPPRLRDGSFSLPITKSLPLITFSPLDLFISGMRGNALAIRGGQRMLGAIETLLSGILVRGLSPALLTVLMAAPLKKVSSAQLKKIYVLDERGEMAGEYVLDADCPLDFNDFLKVLPNEGIGDRDSLFVGEYVFTAFQSGKFVFVLLSRGHLASEDFDWTGLLLTAADSHLSKGAGRTAAPRAAETRPDADKALGERESRLAARERTLAELEVKLKAEAANLQGRQEELNRQKAQLAAVADYSARMQ